MKIDGLRKLAVRMRRLVSLIFIPSAILITVGGFFFCAGYASVEPVRLSPLDSAILRESRGLDDRYFRSQILSRALQGGVWDQEEVRGWYSARLRAIERLRLQAPPAEIPDLPGARQYVEAYDRYLSHLQLLLTGESYAEMIAILEGPAPAPTQAAERLRVLDDELRERQRAHGRNLSEARARFCGERWYGQWWWTHSDDCFASH
jgi:hypothetical protein